MNWFIVYDEMGEAVSIGTVLADQMPHGFNVMELTDDEAAFLLSGRGIWNPATKAVDHNSQPLPQIP